jgi:hypothetical protein
MVFYLLPVSPAFAAAVAAPRPAEAAAAAVAGSSSTARGSLMGFLVAVVVLSVRQPVVCQYSKLTCVVLIRMNDL